MQRTTTDAIVYGGGIFATAAIVIVFLLVTWSSDSSSPTQQSESVAETAPVMSPHFTYDFQQYTGTPGSRWTVRCEDFESGSTLSFTVPLAEGEKCEVLP